MLIGISWRRWRTLPRQRLLSLAKTIGWRGTMTAFATWKSDVQSGHIYIWPTNMSIFSNVDHDHGLIRDPASKKLGNKGITFFLCKNSIYINIINKDLQIRKSSYTATLTTLACLAMIHCLALVAVNVGLRSLLKRLLLPIWALAWWVEYSFVTNNLHCSDL